MDKKTIFSGIQPSGIITLGNYFGALKNWVKLNEDYNCYYSIVDMHSITVRQDPEKLRENCYNLMALYIACGLDPNENIIYIQSHVKEHSELSWILGCYTYMGELSRMTQFKDKSSKNEDNINAGLFTYPVLMAADILLYQTDLVPIGDDQKQHLELTRNIANRFNKIFPNSFTVPKAYYGKIGARIMSLQDPNQKMSKSDPNPNGYLSILDEPKKLEKKIKRAVTDSLGEINYSDDQAGVKNLLDIYICASGYTKEKVMEEMAGKGYGYLKGLVAQAVINEIEPIQKKYKEIVADKSYLDEILKKNSLRASEKASETIKMVKEKIGFISL